MDKKFDHLLEEPIPGKVPSGRAWDSKKVVALSMEEFREFYIASMAEYGDWWEKGPVFCGKCHQRIPSTKKLRVYNGRPLDPTCFLNVYIDERENIIGVRQQYWDKVAALDK